jgi:hypothetical protein
MSTRSLLVLVAGVAGAELAARGYLGGRPLLFQAGLWSLVGVALALATRARARGWRAAAATGGGLGVALALLSLAELAASGQRTSPVAPGWSYRETGGNPEAFAAWAERHPADAHAAAGSARGRTSPGQRGERYRIVVLGGPDPSTGLFAGAGPWSSILASELGRTLRCATPVEIVHAGRPGQSLRETAERFDDDVLPVEPDLVLLQHHPFGDLVADLPEHATAPTPRIPPRGGVLLARLEARLRHFATAARWRKALASPDPRDFADTRTVAFYDAIVRRSQGAGAEVALATFSLPVDASSPEAAIRFYEGAYPKLRRWILGNRRHDRLVRGLAGAWHATFVDTAPELSGAYEDAFFDPLRLTATGQTRLARNVLAGLRPLLVRPRPGCVPVSTARPVERQRNARAHAVGTGRPGQTEGEVRSPHPRGGADRCRRAGTAPAPA